MRPEVSWCSLSVRAGPNPAGAPASRMLRLFTPMFGKWQRLILVWRRDNLPKVVPGCTFSLQLGFMKSWFLMLSKGNRAHEPLTHSFIHKKTAVSHPSLEEPSLMGYLVGMPTLFPLPPFPVPPLPSSFSKISFHTLHHPKASFKFKHCPRGEPLEGASYSEGNPAQERWLLTSIKFYGTGTFWALISASWLTLHNKTIFADRDSNAQKHSVGDSQRWQI